MRLFALLFRPLAIVLRAVFGLLGRVLESLFFPKRAFTELDFEGAVISMRTAPTLPERLLRWVGVGESKSHVVLPWVIAAVDGILRRPRVVGVLVRIGPLDVSWPDAMTLRTQLLRIRGSGRKVIVHLKFYARNAEYLIASAADEIWLGPAAPIAAVGVASATVFLKVLLDRIGVTVEAIAHGRYKSAPDSLTRTERSPFDHEQVKALVDALDGALVAAVAEGRKVELAAAKAMIDAGPQVGQQAIDKKLADRIVRDDEIKETLAKEQPKDLPELEWVDADDLIGPRDFRPITGRLKKQVGVVAVHGAIVDRSGTSLDLGERAAVETEVVADLRAALADRRIGAVVLHVNSRGGSVTASDAIYAAVRRLAKEKPVVACFADVAASGGYYVGCGAQAIVASPLTLTGSIGVFLMLPTWPELAKKLGLARDVIQNHAAASLLDPWLRPTDLEREHAKQEVDFLYERFIELVAEARGLDKATVDAHAEGRVWIGSDAKDRGLVDGLGGFDEAVDRVKALAKRKFVTEPVLVRAKRHLPRPDPIEDAAARAVQTFGGPLAAELLLLQACRGPFAWSPVQAR